MTTTIPDGRPQNPALQCTPLLVGKRVGYQMKHRAIRGEFVAATAAQATVQWDGGHAQTFSAVQLDQLVPEHLVVDACGPRMADVDGDKRCHGCQGKLAAAERWGNCFTCFEYGPPRDPWRQVSS